MVGGSATQRPWVFDRRERLLHRRYGRHQPGNGHATAILNFDAIEEIQLQTAGFEAEYGRAVGGIINVASKSGGNQFSGTLDIRYT